jgi:hypothetical protein
LVGPSLHVGTRLQLQPDLHRRHCFNDEYERIEHDIIRYADVNPHGHHGHHFNRGHDIDDYAGCNDDVRCSYDDFSRNDDEVPGDGDSDEHGHPTLLHNDRRDDHAGEGRHQRAVEDRDSSGRRVRLHHDHQQ